MKKTHTDLVITLVDDPKVRIPFKPEIDEKTKRVKPESIRPDPTDPDRRLGGLAGNPNDLKTRQWVVVALGATRDKPPQFLATAVLIVAEKQ